MQNKKKTVAYLQHNARLTPARIREQSATIEKMQGGTINCATGDKLLVAETPKEQSQSLREYQKMRDQFRELLYSK